MFPHTLKRIGRQLVRVKVVDCSCDNTRLSRCLDTYDLVALGVGSTMGAGVYVVTGAVTKNISGPAVVISFLIAAIAAVMAGLCYAEFGARVPKTGSAYLYSYVTVGELLAFITGWNLLVSYAIGTSSVAKTWASTFDALIGNSIEAWSKKHMPMNAPNVLAEYPDLFAVFIIMILTGVLGFGVKESALVTKLFTSINIMVLVFVMIAGCIKGDRKNWSLNTEDIISNATEGTNKTALKESLGAGGFMPFGWEGIVSGAATCFYAFIGFECITTAGEEVKNPQKAIPVSIITSLLICFSIYVGVSASLTSMIPYYQLDESNPLPRAFTDLGWVGATYTVATGSLCALSTSLLGAMFPMPRVMWAMAEDGLLFRCFTTINHRTKTPLIATLTSGVLAGLMAMLFDLKDLVDLMSIGTLLAYTLVAACVLVLRYQPERRPTGEEEDEDRDDGNRPPQQPLTCGKLILCAGTEPTRLSGTVVAVCTAMLGLLALIFSVVGLMCGKTLWSLAVQVFTMSAWLAVALVVCVQPQNKTKLSFKVPLVPLLPMVSMLVNTFLMIQLMKGPWAHYTCCMAIGLLMYLGYGFRNSTGAEERRADLYELAKFHTESDATQQDI
uniref:high affinity cationic amino acid transporter 1-like n=1 Tax=Doryrhamphus excisus TaxID=161450 RepID=UPI0025ADBBC5|nr:high affinity cationic amino acid transporter 1-like [Doryrhamphus excisus]